MRNVILEKGARFSHFFTPSILSQHPSRRKPSEVRDAITRHTLAVKARVCPDAPYPLGLRLSAVAATELHASHAALDDFADLLTRSDMAVSCINGFPYGAFHGTAVKTAVYEPDWSTPERLAYTGRLAEILAVLLPEGQAGSISTVPLAISEKGQRSEVRGGSRGSADDGVRPATRGHGELLHAISARATATSSSRGNPNPMPAGNHGRCHPVVRDSCCTRERAGSAATAAARVTRPSAAAPRIGLCLDTCHFAVAFEDPLTALIRFESACLRVARIQLSAALRPTISEESLRRLHDFIDPSTCTRPRSACRGPDRGVSRPDRGHAESRARAAGCEVRTHFHVPLSSRATACWPRPTRISRPLSLTAPGEPHPA
jgi:hypothetical protein